MVTCAPIACKHKVSGSVSLPSRGSFHLSLTVLFAIGHRLVFRLGGWALRLHTGLHVSGTTLVSLGPLQISPTGVSPSALCFSKTVRLSVMVPRRDPQPRSASTPVWPLPRSLAATWRIDVSFSSWSYLDVSVHPVSFSHPIDSDVDTCTLLQVGSPIRTSAGHRIFAPNRSLSQLVTSFFGSQCQGIRLVPLFAWPLLSLSSSLARNSFFSFLASRLKS